MDRWPGWGGDECPVCGGFTGEAASPDPLPCPACLRDPPPFRARSLFPYEGPAGDAIRAMKYGPSGGPAAPAAAAIARRLLAEGIRARWTGLFPPAFRPLVVPVPIRPLKYLRRGFNLPSLLAESLAREAGWPCDLSRLERRSDRGPQAGRPAAGRQDNVEGAFRTRRRGAALPADVLLVDDVLTSGATAAACALALKRGGARHIVVVTVARAVRTHSPIPEPG